jgi:hypothetical protein
MDCLFPSSSDKQKVARSTHVAEKTILAITVIAAILCLVPLMVNTGRATASSSPNTVEQSTSNNQLSSTDDAWFFETNDFLQSLSGFFYIVLVPVVDIMLEVPCWTMHLVAQYRTAASTTPASTTATSKQTSKTSKTPTHPQSTIVRLSELERFLFIFGVAFISAASFLPIHPETVNPNPNTNPNPNPNPHLDAYQVYDCATNFSAIMTVGSLLSFLVRATTTLTPLRGVGVLVCVAVGGLADSYQYLFPPHSIHSQAMVTGGYVFFHLGACLFTLVCLTSALSLVRERSTGFTNTGRLARFARYMYDICLAETGHGNPAQEDWYALYVPAFHMLSAFIILWINAVGYSISTDLELVFHFWTRATIASAIIVLVVETRIRKNEVTRGLYALLESKKTYVRFISHEMRCVTLRFAPHLYLASLRFASLRFSSSRRLVFSFLDPVLPATFLPISSLLRFISLPISTLLLSTSRISSFLIVLVSPFLTAHTPTHSSTSPPPTEHP